jgi:hypothetical protein
MTQQLWFICDCGSRYDLEVGQPASGQIRFAFEVPDVEEALSNALNVVVRLLVEPKLTP